MTSDLSGRTALVTGAAQGVGRAVTELLARRGADVLAADVSPPAAISAAAGGQRSAGSGGSRGSGRPEPRDGAKGVVEPVMVDLGDTAAVGDLARDAEARGVDILVNCAAAYPDGDILGTTDDDWLRIMQVNVLAAATLARAATRGLVRRGLPGAVVNVGSVQESLPLPGYSAYVTSKGALSAMTGSLAVELGAYGIRVNAVTLGLVHSPALGAKLGGAFWDGHRVAPPTLLGRTGTPEEAAEAIVFLCSPAASYITGAVLAVDGGRRLSRRPDPQLDLPVRGEGAGRGPGMTTTKTAAGPGEPAPGEAAGGTRAHQ